MQTLTVGSDLSKASHSINWKLMLSLTALYASIVIGWICYKQYQPKLLVQFNFTHFALPLAIVQALVLTITPPFAGRLGDRYRFTRGHRYPIISLGISFAAMVFMAVAFTLISNPGEVFRWILPILIISWLVAMSIFTSPALSTIETFIPVEKLPWAMAILMITGNLLNSLEPVIVDIIDFLGAPITFITGGVFVFGTGLFLRRNGLAFLKNGSETGKPMPRMVLDSQRSSYGFIFLMGSMLGIVTALLFHVFPGMLSPALQELIPSGNGKYITVGVLIVSGLLSLPFSNYVVSYGVFKSFRGSLILSTLSIIGLFGLTSPLVVIVLLILFAIAFTALSVSALPLALERSNYYEKVLCVGIFFSGVALPDGVLEVMDLL
jgi:MFS family permease